MKGDDLFERFVDFGVSALKFSELLTGTEGRRHVAGQLLRSGTSAGANYEEGRGAESKRDFVHKLGITLKEIKESRYWLKIAERAEMETGDSVKRMIQESEELAAIIAQSIKTARENEKQ